MPEVQYLALIGNYQGYWVGDDGSVWSYRNFRGGFTEIPHRLKPKIQKRAKSKKRRSDTIYQVVTLYGRDGSKKSVQVHTLVLTAFKGPGRPGEQCRHHDGNGLNNRLDNLFWGTSGENQEDRIRHGTMPRGENHGRAILTEDLVREIRSSTESLDALARRFGVNRSTIHLVRHRKNWKHVT